MFARLLVIASLATAGCSADPAPAADVVLGKAASASQRHAIDRTNHSTWNELLQEYVDEEGLVDYKAWKASSEDMAILDQYIAHLSAADPNARSSNEARLAYWINAYNAVTVKGILREYPTTSIRNHTAKFFGYNIWKNLLLPVGEQKVSLEHIEHQILRKMNEPRIHFAIVCASIGCPRLLNEAYVPEKLDQQLATNAEHFFRQPRHFRADRSANSVYLSSILDWFAEDFGSDQAAQLRTVSEWVPEQQRAFVTKQGITVRYLDYDWGINDQK